MDVLDRRALLVGAASLAAGGCSAEGAIVPSVARPALPGMTRAGWPAPGFAESEFRGSVKVLNMWASWCPYCRSEHSTLMRVARDGRVALYGLLHRDEPAAGARYLRAAGDPYRAVASDPDGRFARALRQSAVPATFVVNRDGIVTKLLLGALSDARVAAELMPAVAAARAEPGRA